jgi:hypothetical protein
MTPEQAAHETRDAIVRGTGRFMMDPEAYAHGGMLGFDGMDFYLAGRAGVLGDVPGDVVAAALVFFAPETVCAMWDRAGAVMPRAQAAQAWADWAYAWARAHFTADLDWTRLAHLLARIVAAAPVAGAPLFAGWRLLPQPDDPQARTVYGMNALRELRGALHGAAVLTVGLSPLEAVSVRSPEMVSAFGWPEVVAETAPLRERWALAEARTDRMLGRHFSVLDETERKELVEMLGATLA